VRTPDSGEGSASQKTLTARGDFWAAAFALADREIPGNPISTLKTAVWPKWQEIINSRPPGRFRYLSLAGVKQ
jgi:hypothetical protein